MLFVQYISIVYYKNVRYANYTNERNAIKFLPIVCNNVPDCEVFVQNVPIYQGINGIKKYSQCFKEYGEEIYKDIRIDPCKKYPDIISNVRILKTDGGYKIRFCDERYFFHNPFSSIRRGHNEEFTNHKSPFGYKDIINETAFNLKPDEYGRIIFNERFVDRYERWYYVQNVINFINCDKSKYREKMFFRKVPDYEYKNMQYLKYC